MTKADWEKVQKEYPRALKSCLEWFQNKYGDFWRTEIKDHERLFEFLDEMNVKVQVTRYRNKFGFTLKYGIGENNKDCMYADIIEAERVGIQFGFRFLESDLIWV